MLAFIGIRGVVSLAAALAVPFTLQNGAPFPYRETIIVVVFGVIILTLVGQGLLMPAVARLLHLPRLAAQEKREEREAELRVRRAALAIAERRLQALSDANGLKEEAAKHLRARNHQRSLHMPQLLEKGSATAATNAQLHLELIKAEREFLHELLRKGEITDESRRRIERELDLEEESIFCNRDAYEPPL